MCTVQCLLPRLFTGFFIIIIHLFFRCCCCCLLLKLFDVKVNKLHTGSDLQLRYTNTLFHSIFQTTTTLRERVSMCRQRNVAPGDTKIGQFEIWRCRMMAIHSANAHCIFFAYFPPSQLCVCLFVCSTVHCCTAYLNHDSGSNLSFEVNKNDLWQLWTE